MKRGILLNKDFTVSKEREFLRNHIHFGNCISDEGQISLKKDTLYELFTIDPQPESRHIGLKEGYNEEENFISKICYLQNVNYSKTVYDVFANVKTIGFSGDKLLDLSNEILSHADSKMIVIEMLNGKSTLEEIEFVNEKLYTVIMNIAKDINPDEIYVTTFIDKLITQLKEKDIIMELCE